MDNDTPAQAASAAPSADAVALCVEGGGMRMAYMGALVCALAEDGLLSAGNGVTLACGISAGSSVTANFVANVPWRTRAMFVDAVTSEGFGGVRELARGHGYFNADYLYEGCIEDGSYPFDYESFRQSHCDYACQALEADTGRTAIWRKRDFTDVIDMASHIRASSTMPLAMRPIMIDGHLMFDGGLGRGAGIPYTIAQALGYERFIVVRSRVKEYRKKPVSRAMAEVYFRWAEEWPLVAKALIDRPFAYNESIEALDALEREGRALVIYPDEMPLKSTTIDYRQLDSAWKAGSAQGQRERERVAAFLGA